MSSYDDEITDRRRAEARVLAYGAVGDIASMSATSPELAARRTGRRSRLGALALAVLATGAAAGAGWAQFPQQDRLRTAAASHNLAQVAPQPADARKTGDASNLEAGALALQSELRAAVEAILPDGETQNGLVQWATTPATSGMTDNAVVAVTWRDARGSATFYAVSGTAVMAHDIGVCGDGDKAKAEKKCKTLTVPGEEKQAKLFTPLVKDRLGRAALILSDDGSKIRLEQRAGIVNKPAESGFGVDLSVKIVNQRTELPLTDEQLLEVAQKLS